MIDGRTRIDLWLLPVNADDEAHHADLINGLADAERAEHDRRKLPDDRLLYAAAHSLKRQALSERFGGAPQDWTFSDGAYGKPRLSNPPDGRQPRFNLSHAPGLVAVAIADGIELGLDVEVCDPAHADHDTAMAFAHPSESPMLDPAAPDFVDRFYRLWTRKEALAKATGLGLSLELRALVFDDELAGHWHLMERTEPTGHRMALLSALKADPPEIIEHRVKMAALAAMAV